MTHADWKNVQSHNRRQRVFSWRDCKADSITMCPTDCHPYKPVQRDPRTKLFLNCLAGVQGTSLSTQWPRCRCLNLLDNTWKPPLQISLHEVCLSREVCLVARAVIGHLSASGKGSRFGYCQRPNPGFQIGPMRLEKFLWSRGTSKRILVPVVCSIMKLFKYTFNKNKISRLKTLEVC
jgi:hypothetical protein